MALAPIRGADSSAIPTSEVEEWRPAVGFEHAYEVSDQGQVRSIIRTVYQWNGVAYVWRQVRGQMLSLIDVMGYLKVGLYPGNGGRQKLVFVHVLVCEAFHGQRPAGMQAAHGNGDRMDCRAVNLRWATTVENAADRDLHGRTMRGEAHYGRRLSEDDVRSIRLSGVGHKPLARQYGVSDTAIRRIRSRVTWKHVA